MRKTLVAIILIVALFSTGCEKIVTVSHKRFGTLPVDVKTFVTPDSVSSYKTEAAAWRALEDGYIYEADAWSLCDCGSTEKIPGGNDFWLYPVETQYLIDVYPESHSMDCEDGAAWLASAFKKLGLDAWFVVGTVLVGGVTYGHAWTMVKEGSDWETYETTVDEVIEGQPAIYTINWRTNGETTWVNYASTGIELTISQIPISKLDLLKKTIVESGGV